MKSLFAFVTALVVAAFVASVAYASPATVFTGPAGTNPLNDGQNVLSSLNQSLNEINAAISNGAALGTSVGIFSNGGFQVMGQASTGSMTLGTSFPTPSTLGSTTVKFYLTFFDSQGKQSYIPVWQ